jgi:hypothetical protein
MFKAFLRFFKFNLSLSYTIMGHIYLRISIKERTHFSVELKILN